MSCFNLTHAELTLDLYGKVNAVWILFHEKKVKDDQVANKFFRMNFMSILIRNKVPTNSSEENMKMFVNWMEGKQDYGGSCVILTSFSNDLR